MSLISQHHVKFEFLICEKIVMYYNEGEPVYIILKLKNNESSIYISIFCYIQFLTSLQFYKIAYLATTYL